METNDKNDKGLGDTIARVTTAVGIKPCGGCQQRKEALNKLVPYREKQQKEEA